MREALLRPAGRGGMHLPRTLFVNMVPSVVPSIRMSPVSAQARNAAGWQPLGRTDYFSNVQCKVVASGIRAVAEPGEHPQDDDLPTYLKLSFRVILYTVWTHVQAIRMRKIT